MIKFLNLENEKPDREGTGDHLQEVRNDWNGLCALCYIPASYLITAADEVGNLCSSWKHPSGASTELLHFPTSGQNI